MAHPSFDYAALSTLNLWLMTDSHVHHALQGPSQSGKLDAIARAAPRFGYSHELNTKHDAGRGLLRFQPALDVIDKLDAESFAEDTVKSMRDVSDQLSSQYGNENVFSATTKLLWLKFRYPIIIYDERIATVLGTRLTRDYYDQWQARFKYHEQSVADACLSLVDALTYVCDPDVATKEFVAKVSTSTWFQHRAFGSYLTFMGRNAV